MQHTKKHTRFYLLHTIVPLITGCVIYLLLRPDTRISIWFYKVIGQLPVYDGSFLPAEIYTFLRNYSCDMLWAYALPTSVWYFQEKNAKKLKSMFVECIVFEIMLELLQYTEIISGTFDLWDILLEAASSLLAIRVINRTFYQNVHTP